MVYRIRLEQFEGPLDLLLALTEQQKLDITRVSLAAVADQYLEYINNKDNVTLESLADFLSVAARLILIKSKALLPLLEFTEEEEEEIKDLEKQLVEYKKFRDIAAILGQMDDARRVCISRDAFTGLQRVFYPPENIGAAELHAAFRKVLGEIPSAERLEEEMVKEVLTLEEKIVHLQDLLRKKAETSFAEIAASAKDRTEVVVSFLAMLELVKQQIVHVEQSELFQEIKMRRRNEKAEGGE